MSGIRKDNNGFWLKQAKEIHRNNSVSFFFQPNFEESKEEVNPNLAKPTLKANQSNGPRVCLAISH
jgi:hypothetical protein